MRVLVVEDDEKIRNLLFKGLSAAGYEVMSAASAEEGALKLKEFSFDGFILDVMLPGKSGTEFCHELRDQGMKSPILMVTAKTLLEDKITGLDQGADDYITKPFEMAEVIARLRALIRKTQGYPKEELHFGDLVLDPNYRTLKKAGVPVDLTPKELLILEFFMKNQGRLISREMLAQTTWGADFNTYTNVIDVFISHIRKKIEGSPGEKLIQTIRGRGYVFGASQEG